MAQDKKPSWFKFKVERRALLEKLPPESAVKVLMACFDFLECQEPPQELSLIEDVAFSAFKPDVEEALANYKQRITARSQSNDVARNRPTSSEGEEEPEEDEELEEENIEKDIPPISPKGGNEGAFESFWSAYPRRVGKGNAEKAWKKLNPNAELTGRILSAIEKCRKSEQWTKDSGQFIPYPATWLNRKGWEDDLDACPTRTSSYDIDELERMSFFDVPEEL